jgi:thiol-disulfide isomerase/thioredoxin
MVRISTFIVSIILTSALLMPAAAEEKKDVKPGDKPAAEQQAAPKPEGEKAAADPYAVPEGTPQELIGFIRKILQNVPDSEETRKKMRTAMIQAADKIIAAKPKDDELDFAVDVKMHFLDKPEEVTAFGEELKKSGHEKQARMVRGFLLQLNMREAIISGNKDLKKSIEEVIKFLQEAPPQASDLGLAIMTGQIAEHQGDNAYAIEVYRQLGKIFSDSKEPRLAEFGKKLAGVVRRLSLLGQKMELEGKLLSGENLEISKYKGKVLLVDFWATWCGPCIVEIPNLKKNYETYHDKGFDILGFSCDYRREDLEKFVKEKEIPWAIVYGDDGPSPTVDFYGIMGIPTCILIDKDGNVIDLNARGEELDKQLEKLFGPPQEKKDVGAKNIISGSTKMK